MRLKPAPGIVILGLALAGLWPMRGSAELQVVASLPDLAALAREIGGPSLRLTSLGQGTEDPHFVDPKPSFVRVLNRADLLLEGGAGLESAWLPPLLQASRNPRIQGTGAGHFLAAQGLALLEVPAAGVDRSQGDVHPAGNPHFLLNPDHCRTVARRLAGMFAQLDPADAARYREGLRQFEEKLDGKTREWRDTLAPLRGSRVLTYHKSFNYLLDYFGLELVGTIEPKPGIEPSPAHIQSLLSRLRAQPPRIILIEPNRPRKTAEQLASALKARLVVAPLMPGGLDRTTDFFTWFDRLVAEVAGPRTP